MNTERIADTFLRVSSHSLFLCQATTLLSYTIPHHNQDGNIIYEAVDRGGRDWL
jgi:hypothetical protein